jgi:glucokinase
MKALGIEIGGTKLQLVVGDETGKILQRRKLRVSRAGGAAEIREQIARTIPELLAGHVIAAVGVGFGGPVDWRTGKICCSHQIAGWSGFDLRGWLEGQTGVPVEVDNDANVAALAEAICGAGRGSDPVFFVTLGSGVGGGLVIAGKIYRGANPGESEIGHLRLDRAGTTLESRCSGWAVDARIRELKRQEPGGLLARLIENEPGCEARHLAAAIAQEDASAHRIVLEVAEDLAFGLSHVVHLFHPEAIVLGGGLTGVGEPLRAAVENALRTFTMAAFLPGPRICLSQLGEDVVTTGALCLARTVRAVR